MLETISWKEYGLLSGGTLLLYYGWWAVKYAASLGWGLPKPGSREADGRLAGLYDLPKIVVPPVDKNGTASAGERTKEVMVGTKDVTAAKEEAVEPLSPQPPPAPAMAANPDIGQHGSGFGEAGPHPA
ncbi:hypothetical protein [Puia dinghuensis]|uniref:Uncharacterized protein n=1 Tax=Puia dinghuensis TaxID=1792502 RepID=A0A8J2UIA6_9BACT|nr:hypothetical protein [Puia dinghuensis]GGB20068.1 hypothetical protein GCM10011511_49740 [Puia dinghuensis]